MTLAIVLVAVLLAIGIALRQTVTILRSFLIPASVIAGFVGLALVSLGTSSFAGESLAGSVNELTGILSGWPGPLIAVVFAAMMLQSPATDTSLPQDSSTTSRVGRQALMVWVIVLGETLVGLLATWCLIQPRYDVPNSFGFLIETGFAGGHGTAGAMGQVYSSAQVGLEEGLDLGMLMATCGLVYGLVSGIAWINLAARLGWVKPPGERASGETSSTDSRKPIGHSVLSFEVIDPLLLQAVWIALAFAIGMGMQWCVMSAAGLADAAFGIGAGSEASGASAELSKRLAVSNLVDFPLFIYTMFGGWLVRRGLRVIGKPGLIDSATIHRLSGTAMEVLVVAAITSLRLSKVVDLLGPFLILFICGTIWTGLCLMVFARWVLPREHWFQLGLINYGMSTGTTATGFVLLRVVDPELETSAASDYALAAPFSSPFVGGGIFTIGMPLLVMERVSIAWPTLVIGLVVAALLWTGARWNRREIAAQSES